MGGQQQEGTSLVFEPGTADGNGICWGQLAPPLSRPPYMWATPLYGPPFTLTSSNMKTNATHLNFDYNT